MKRIVFITGACALMMFTLFSWTVKRGAFRSADFAFTVKVQEAIDRSPRLRLSRFVGEVMEGSTFFASPEFSIFAIFTLTIFAFTTLRSIDTSKYGAMVKAFIIPCLFTLLVLAEIYGKNVVHHPAPPFFMIKNPTTIFPKYYINDQFSYPSGHAARAVFLSCISLYLIRNTLYTRKKYVQIGSLAVILLYMTLVSISRIYLGHHWLSDIIGGVLLGAGLGFWACIQWYTIKKHS